MQVLKEEIREKIIQVAKAKFLESGFQKTSMKSIAVGAGISAPTIYCYFRNKEDLFIHLVEPVTTYFVKRKKQWKKQTRLNLQKPGELNRGKQNTELT